MFISEAVFIFKIDYELLPLMPPPICGTLKLDGAPRFGWRITLLFSLLFLVVFV